MTRTAFFTDERTFWHTAGTQVHTLPVGGWIQPSSSAGAVDTPDSRRRLLALIDVSGLGDALEIQSAPAATQEDLLRVHTPAYLAEFKRLSDAGGGNLSGTAPFGRDGFEIAALSAGLAKAAVVAVVSGRVPTAYALSRPPGHHCQRALPLGGCLLANIPIAIEAARADYGPLRVAIVDWDVHHGNGAQTIYYDDPDTLTISLHQDRNFFPAPNDSPGYRGAGAGDGANINIPLLPGGGHDAYLYAVQRLVQPAIAAFRPDLLVIANGLDGCAVDPMGRMLLHSESYRAMTQAMLAAADRFCGGRLAVVHEGGYSEVYAPFCGLAVVEALAGVRTAVEDPMLQAISSKQSAQAFVDLQRRLIDEMHPAIPYPVAGRPA